MTVLSASLTDTTMGAELKTGAAMVSATDAEAMAREIYGLSGHAEWLWGEKDANYRLTLEDGERYLLKILNPAEDLQVSMMHSAALAHVAERDAEIPIQRVVPALDGMLTRQITDQSNQLRSVRLVTFLPGIAQRRTPPSALQHYNAGVMLGRLQHALADFQHPAARHHIIWDMTHATAMRDLLPYISNSTLRQDLAHYIDRFEQQVMPVMSALPMQVIHNDFNAENILTAEQDAEQISGIIDFGDMVYAPRLFDVAIAASYQIDQDPLTDISHFLTGYATQQTLTEQEITLLYPAILMRMVMRLTIAQWRSALFPEHRERMTQHNPLVERQLAQLEAIPQARILAHFTAAAKGE